MCDHLCQTMLATSANLQNFRLWTLKWTQFQTIKYHMQLIHATPKYHMQLIHAASWNRVNRPSQYRPTTAIDKSIVEQSTGHQVFGYRNNIYRQQLNYRSLHAEISIYSSCCSKHCHFISFNSWNKIVLLNIAVTRKQNSTAKHCGHQETK